MCGLTFIVFVAHWNGFDDLVVDDLPRICELSPSVSEELHSGQTGGEYSGGADWERR